MKKIISLLALMACLGFESKAGIITTNISAGTNLIFTGRVSAYQIDIYSGTANVLKVYDTKAITLLWTNAAYTGSSNKTMNLTNIYTNGIWEYPGVSTQMLLMTNIILNANFRTNFTVAASTSNAVPVAVNLFVPAAGSTSIDGVDLNFLNGITVTVTNDASLTIYTR